MTTRKKLPVEVSSDPMECGHSAAVPKIPALEHGGGVRRREFFTLLGGAVAWPAAVRAQQPVRMRRIGLLSNNSENDLEAQHLITAFREGLAQLGWTDGHNLRID